MDDRLDRELLGEEERENHDDGEKKKEKKRKKKKRRQRRRWLRELRDVDTPAVDITFQVMQMRKVMRKINGTYESDKPWTMLWVFLTLLLFFGVAGANFKSGHFEVKFTTGQLTFVSLVAVVAFLVIVYTLTRVIVVFRWMLYWLLSAQVLTILLYKEYNLFSTATPLWIPILLCVLEVLTAFIYLFANHLYPRLLGSEWFRKYVGPKNFWEVRVIGPWTLTYSGGFGNRHTCTYRGETNEAGLPHGYGHWMDDSYHGEILTGWWENGKPIGPFRSREFGSGYAFDNVMIAYVMATDDDFESYKLIPTNDKPFRCGVASVECSVSGGFFSHLPSPKVLHGPFHLARGSNSVTSESDIAMTRMSLATVEDGISDEEGTLPEATIASLMANLRHLSAAHPLSSILISAKEGRGVSVAGHIFNQNGKSNSRSCRQLVIDVVYPGEQRGEHLQLNSASPKSIASADLENVGHLGNESAHQLSNLERGLHRKEEKEEDDDDDDDDDDDMSSDENENCLATPSLRSSLRLSEFDETRVSQDRNHPGDLSDNHTLNEEDEDLEDSDDDGESDHEDLENGASVKSAKQRRKQRENDNFDSDLESIDYDSGVFRLDQESVARAKEKLSRMRHNFSSTSLSNEDKKRMLMDTSAHCRSGPIKNGFDEATGHFQPVDTSSSVPYLHVRGWRSTIEGHAEALIFVPGFNCSVKHSLERFGQFLAMGHFPPYIKPFLFSWPAGTVATYLKAVSASQSTRTAQAFGMLLDGLYDAGIRDVHIMTHSMGVQALLGSFQDTPEGQRSPVSLRFSLAPDFLSESRTSESVGTADDLQSDTSSSGNQAGNGRGLLRCRTITLLNPDFPLGAFVDHSFATIRRVCDHITVVGNRKDQALFWSELANGIVKTLDYYVGSNSYPAYLSVPTEEGEGKFSGPRDPDTCCPKCCTFCLNGADAESEKYHGMDRLFSRQLSTGRTITSLFARLYPEEEMERRESLVPSSSTPRRHRVSSYLFRGPQSLFQRMRRKKKKRRNQVLWKPWLDLDAIDTTWMESNVHALRHNYFNLNPVLIEDLSELIVTGRRAADRSTLLHREGNIYSYCQAPAFVVNQS